MDLSYASKVLANIEHLLFFFAVIGRTSYNSYKVLLLVSLESFSMILENKRNVESVDWGLLAECKAAVREVSGDADLILFGSRARGDAQDDSDYDLLVLVDAEPDMDMEQAMVGKLFPLECRSGKVLTVFVYAREQWDSALYQAMPFHKNVSREGMVV